MAVGAEYRAQRAANRSVRRLQWVGNRHCLLAFAGSGCGVEIFKDKLPASISYALKPSALETALRSAGVATSTALYQWRRGWAKDGLVFRATFYPPGTFGENAHELLSVSSHALPSHLRAKAGQFIETSVIPEFIAWISEIEALDRFSVIRREQQDFTRSWLPPIEGS